MIPHGRRQFTMSQMMLAVVVAAFDSLIVAHGALLWHRGAIFLRQYVANSAWPSFAVIGTGAFLWWVARRR